MLSNCNAPRLGARRLDPAETPPPNPALERARLINEAYQAAAQAPTANNIEAFARNRQVQYLNRWEMDVGSLIHLKPEATAGIMDWAVARFGQTTSMLGLGMQNSVVGEVRYNLLRARQAIEGLIMNAARFRGAQRADMLMQEFSTVMRSLDVPQYARNTFLLDLIEIGQQPRNLSAFKRYEVVQDNPLTATPPTMVQQFMQQRYQRFVQRATGFGIGQDQLNRLVNSAVALSNVYDEVRALATAVGVTIGEVENISYFNRIVTDDFRRRLGDVRADDLLGRGIGNYQPTTDITTPASARSRSTFYLLPHDTEFVNNFLGLTNVNIGTLVDDPQTLTRLLRENLTPADVEFLTDVGALAEIPMTSTEIFRYFVNEYQLPYRDISEMFMADPRRALDRYAQDMSRAAGNSALVRSLSTGSAFDAGWAVNRQVFDSNPQYSNFRSLTESLQNWTRRANRSVEEFAADMNLPEDFLETASNVYVHPIVADQWAALMEISASPSLMGGLGYMMHKYGQFFSKSTILSSNIDYVSRNTLGNFVVARAAGGNAMNDIPAMRTVQRVFAEGFDWLDNSRRVYRDGDNILTQREFVEKFFQFQGQGLAPGVVSQQFTPGRPGEMASWLLGRPQAVVTSLRNIIDYTMASGASTRYRNISPSERMGRFARVIADNLDNTVTDLFAPLALVGNMSEIGFKLSTAMTLATNTPSNRIGQVLTSGRYLGLDSMDSILRHIDNYWQNPYDIGTVTNSVRGLVPFASWALSNVPNTMRALLHNPTRFANYFRLSRVINRPLAEDEDVNQATIPGWMAAQHNLYVGRDLDGNPMVMFPSNWNPYIEGTERVKETTNSFLRMMGTPAGTQSQIRSMLRGDATQDFILSMLNATYLTPAIEQLMGQDLFTGASLGFGEEERITVAGISMNARLAHMVTSLPIIDRVNRTLPDFITGRAPEYDLIGRLVEPGQPSWTGAVPTRNVQDNLARASWTAKMLSLTGMNVRSIDLRETSQYTLRDIEGLTTELSNELTQERDELRRMYANAQDGIAVDLNELERRREQYDTRVSYYVQLRVDAARVRQFMFDRGIPTNRMLQELQRMQLDVRDLPDVQGEAMDAVMEEVSNLWIP